jgi:UDP-N-acetylmuramoyl-L-alanyl-D-glutamate--2,6-diaminopimelate ligase
MNSFSTKPTVNLKTLIKDIPVLQVEGSMQRAIGSLVTDSRRVTHGALFFALPGQRTDGNFFLQEAIDRGASVVISELPARPHPRITHIQVEDCRKALAIIAKRFFGRPDERLALTGVTGTNGKTTVTTMLHHFLSAERSTGLLGTILYRVGKRTFPSFHTTPEVVDTFSMLASMVEQDCREAVMEVSSHGINQKRVEGMHFDVVAFLNLTQDHLDYHQTLEEYFDVKQRLFNDGTGDLPRSAVIGVDSVWGKRLLERVDPRVGVTTFGIREQADFQAKGVRLSATGSQFQLHSPAGVFDVETVLLGHYNVENILAALAIGWNRGLRIEGMLKSLRTFSGVPGRMETIANEGGFNVVVDYAHTDDALRNALSMLREITPGKIHIVFGCGGNRDRLKRPLMAKAAEEVADTLWVTADNPRFEDLETIFADMREGFSGAKPVNWITDRRRAISLALDQCQAGDCLLIAGKGHETYQEFAGTVTPFDDRQVVRELLAVKGIGRK